MPRSSFRASGRKPDSACRVQSTADSNGPKHLKRHAHSPHLRAILPTCSKRCMGPVHSQTVSNLTADYIVRGESSSGERTRIRRWQNLGWGGVRA